MNTQTENGKLKHDVDELLQLFKSKNVRTLRSFIEQCPPAQSKDVVIDAIREYVSPEVMLLALNMLVEPYSRGIEPQLGINLSKAIYLYSHELFAQNPTTSHLSNAGSAAVNCVIGLNALGKHEELITFAEAAQQWLVEKGYPDVKPNLLLSRIEALIDLARYEEAEILLTQTDWQLLIKERPGDFMRKESLAQRVKHALQAATELPSVQPPTSDKEVMKENRRTLLDNFAKMAEIMPPEIGAMVKGFAEKSKTPNELEKDLPSSLAEWALENQKRMDHLVDLASGKPAKDVLRDYLKTIGRTDLTEKLLGGTSLLNDESNDSKP